MDTGATPLTPRERRAIAHYLRRMAGDTQMLLCLADATLCGDVAALLRARAVAVEQPVPAEGGMRPAGLRLQAPVYRQV